MAGKAALMPEDISVLKIEKITDQGRIITLQNQLIIQQQNQLNLVQETVQTTVQYRNAKVRIYCLEKLNVRFCAEEASIRCQKSCSCGGETEKCHCVRFDGV